MAPFKLQNGPQFLQIDRCHDLVPYARATVCHPVTRVRIVATEAILVEAIVLILGLVSLGVMPGGVVHARS